MNIVHIIIASAIAIVITLMSFGFLGGGSFFSARDFSQLGDAVQSESNDVAAVVKVSTGSAGGYLTDSEGIALYTTTRVCEGQCLVNWPPYFVSGNFRTSGELGVVVRQDVGRAQYTWEGKQLYYYIGDKIPGDINGHNL